MNIGRLTTLAEFFEKGDFGPHEFDMQHFAQHFENTVGYLRYLTEKKSSVCGTAMCIGGWTTYLFAEDSDHFGEMTAKRMLGLNWYESEALFFNEHGFISKEFDLEGITPKMAAAAIRRLIAQGGIKE